ncbi:hypothetical protein [Ornithinibacillus bavariensis]|uniref:hypothetical protein n=1 Tax=Ornithinibacillus bavariensis TaxID=545502 RepID=UPI000EC6AE59|nr:hypothetical protein [Ornithinibacillus sp.]
MNLSGILAILKLILPVPSIAIAGIAISIIIFYFKFSPVSSLTAEEIQIRLFSKEKRILVNLINYIIKTFVWSIIIFGTTLYLIKFNKTVSLIYDNIIFPVLIIEILFFMLLISKEYNQIGKINEKIKNVKLFRLLSKLRFKKKFRFLLVAFYMLLIITTFSSLLAHMYNLFNDTIDLNFILAVYLVTYLVCLIIPFISSPCADYITGETVNKYKDIYILDDNENRWYIYYPINKSFVLLGNNKDEILCSQKKILKFEDLNDLVIYLEKNVLTDSTD